MKPRRPQPSAPNRYRWVMMLLFIILSVVGFLWLWHRWGSSWILGETSERYIDPLFANVSVIKNIQYGIMGGIKTCPIFKSIF